MGLLLLLVTFGCGYCCFVGGCLLWLLLLFVLLVVYFVFTLDFWWLLVVVGHCWWFVSSCLGYFLIFVFGDDFFLFVLIGFFSLYSLFCSVQLFHQVSN